MRQWLFNRVQQALVGTPWEGQLYASGGVDERMAPFAVLAMMVEQPFFQMPVTDKKTNNVPFVVNIHSTAGDSLLPVDAAAIKVRDGVRTQDAVVTGGISILEIRWTDTGQDGFDDHWGTDFRPVHFNAVIAK